jgi:crotonobetainyl-CoA:carnitine CoA-transferase CaiB-like acyl-CoA transferase
VALDLSRPEGREVLDDLVRVSDAMIENFRPDSAARLGLGADRLEKLNRGLVRCSITGFGQTGPWRDRPGYDPVIQALCGLMSITGVPDGEPMKVGVAITDVIAGLYAAVSILAGLVARGKTASGAAFDLALMDCSVASLVNVAQAYLVSRQTPPRCGNAHPQIVPFQCFETADGYLVLAAGNDPQWQRFCQAAGRADWAGDRRFATNPSRVEHRQVLVPQIVALMKTRRTAEWIEALTSADVPHGPVLDLPEVFSHPQVQAREMIAPGHVGAGEPDVDLVASPMRLLGQPLPKPLSPRRLGQDTDRVLAGVLGYTSERIRALRESGVIA